jgi:hypothetical protein
MYKPSAALIVSSIALFVALGGTSYAVTKLPRNSVGTAQLKSNAVTASKVKDKTLQLADLSPAAKTGLTGPKGDTGPTGTTTRGFVRAPDTTVVETSGVIDSFTVNVPVAGSLNLSAAIGFNGPGVGSAAICATPSTSYSAQLRLDGTTIATGPTHQSTEFFFGETLLTQNAVTAGTHTLTLRVVCATGSLSVGGTSPGTSVAGIFVDQTLVTPNASG